MNVASFSITGSSGVNADRFFIADSNDAFAVSDGASGSHDKQSASQICIATIQEHEPFSGVSPDDVRAWFQEANYRLMMKCQRDEALSFATLTAACLGSNEVIVACVGDSPAYLLRDDALVCLTQPRKRYSALIENGLLSETEIDEALRALHPYLHSAFDYFLPMVVPDVYVANTPTKPGDVLLMYTDGVEQVLTPTRIADQITRRSRDLSDVVADIKATIEQAKETRRIDDATLIVIEL